MRSAATFVASAGSSIELEELEGDDMLVGAQHMLVGACWGGGCDSNKCIGYVVDVRAYLETEWKQRSTG